MYNLSLTWILGAAFTACLELAVADELSGVWSSRAGYVISVVELKLEVEPSGALAIFTLGDGRDQGASRYIVHNGWRASITRAYIG